MEANNYYHRCEYYPCPSCGYVHCGCARLMNEEGHQTCPKCGTVIVNVTTTTSTGTITEQLHIDSKIDASKIAIIGAIPSDMSAFIKANPNIEVVVVGEPPRIATKESLIDPYVFTLCNRNIIDCTNILIDEPKRISKGRGKYKPKRKSHRR